MPQGQRVGKVHVYGVSSVCLGLTVPTAFSVLVLHTTQQHWTPVGLTCGSVAVPGTVWTSGVGSGG